MIAFDTYNTPCDTHISAGHAVVASKDTLIIVAAVSSHVNT